MKKKLLSFVLASIAFTTISTAQTKVWDLGNDLGVWPLNSNGIGAGTTGIIVDNMGLFPHNTNTNFGVVSTQNNTFSDGFISVNRFQMNGGGAAAAGTYLPTLRFLFLDVDSDCVVKVWFKTGSNGATRTIFVTDGTSLIGSATTNNGTNTDTAIVTATYNGTGGRLYIYGDNANNLMKVEVVGANVNTTLGVDDFTQVTTNVHSYKNQVYVSNVLTASEVKVFNIMGALVKSFTTTTDTDFQLNQSGLYIVNIKTEEGEKSVKVALN